MALWTLAPPQQAMVADAGLSSWVSSAPQSKTVTSDSTPQTKGAYTEIDAATLGEWAGFTISPSSGNFTAATDTSMLLDIAVGDAGSEVVVLADLPVGYMNYTSQVDVPLRIPAGVRVAGRVQAAVSSDGVAFSTTPRSGAGFTGTGSYQTATTYGADTATSRGVAVTASASANNTFGDWAVIAATTSAPIRAMILGVQGNADTELVGTWRLEVGFGAAGTEVAVATVATTVNSSEYMSMGSATARTGSVPCLLTPTVAIPEGARLVARLATSTSTTTLPSVDVVIIGLR